MEEASLVDFLDGQDLDIQGSEALLAEDPKTVLWNMLLEQVSDPVLAAIIQFMLAGSKESHAGQHAYAQLNKFISTSGEVDVRSSDVQLSSAQETLSYVTRMLGACSICCGELASCPECGGIGKPGRFPSVASDDEFRAWIEPALSRMGMHIADSREVHTTDIASAERS